MTLRISDLPRVVGVTANDYIVINSNNLITSSISAYNFSQYVGHVLFQSGVIPDFNMDGGDVVPPGEIVDGGHGNNPPKPGEYVYDGGTPTTLGYGPNVDGGWYDDVYTPPTSSGSGSGSVTYSVPSSSSPTPAASPTYTYY